MTSSQIPPWLDQLLASPPPAGTGVHGWLFKVARQLHAHTPAAEIVRLLENRTAACGRHVPRREIIAAVQDALECAWQPQGIALSTPAATKWPQVNHEQREAVLRDGPGLADLWESSPVRFEDGEQHTEEILDRLFPGDPLLCCGRTSSQFATRRREAWRGQLSTLALIVPSPMTTPTGTTKDGRVSAHTLSNTGQRRFQVVEFDRGTVDEQAAILMHLAKYAPLALAVHSGRKSLHGWFYVADTPDDHQHRFMRFAVSLGADPATWTRSQFVRMPDGLRDNGARQTVYFFNPLLVNEPQS